MDDETFYHSSAINDEKNQLKVLEVAPSKSLTSVQQAFVWDLLLVKHFLTDLSLCGFCGRSNSNGQSNLLSSSLSSQTSSQSASFWLSCDECHRCLINIYSCLYVFGHKL